MESNFQRCQSRSLTPSPTLRLLPAYMGSIRRYAAMLASEGAEVDCCSKFNKRFKTFHRTTIVDANGVINLTLPIVKPKSHSLARWSDILISDHDSWWHIHLEALKSAYGRTPFFEFYLDDFAPFYTSEWSGTPLVSYLEKMDIMLLNRLCIDTPLSYMQKPESIGSGIALDDIKISDIEYYQSRKESFGFIPGLSIVDLLFNMGPEAALVLSEMARSAFIAQPKPAAVP